MEENKLSAKELKKELDLELKLKDNQKIKDFLKSNDLRKQLNELIDKKREKDIYTLLNNYYGGKICKNNDETILKDYIIESDGFKQFIIELINLIEES